MNNYELIQLGQRYPKMTFDGFDALNKLRWAVLKHHSLCERYCNEADFNPELIEEQEKKVKHLFGEIPFSIPVELEEIQNDPRGYTVKTSCYFITRYINERRL